MDKTSKLKRVIIYITVTIILCMGLTSCKNNNIVNNSETGEIENGEIKYIYTDGTYITVSEYYNNDGYAYGMKLTVKNGIINSVRYDMFDINFNRFSLSKEEHLITKAEFFKAEVKTLVNTLLQNQTSFKITNDENYAYAFKTIANATIENAKTGNEEILFLDLKEEYTQNYVNSENNITSTLKVVYNHGVITDLEFTRANEFNTVISNYSYENLQDIPISYKELMEYLNKLPEDEITLKKDNPTDYPLIEVADYNYLCNVINSIRKDFSPDYDSLFSNL